MILQNGWFFYWNQPFPYNYFAGCTFRRSLLFLGTFFTAPF